jgi:Flp pilus assembly pilin Flp
LLYGFSLGKGAVMRQLLSRLICEDRGQDLVEYAFLAIFIALAVTVGLQALTSGLNSGYSNLGTQVSTGS